MPLILNLEERNDVPASEVAGSFNPGGGFVITGVARAGHSSAGTGSWFQGTYGALMLNADGSYSYRLDNTDSDTNVLAAGQLAEDRFTYTYTLNGVVHTDTITVRVTGIDEPGQQVLTANQTLIFPHPATFDNLSRIVSTATLAVTVQGNGTATSIANGSIRVGGSTASEAIGVNVSVSHPENPLPFQNNGRIEAIAGLTGQGAIGILGSSTAPLVNNGVVRAASTATGVSYQSRAVGISGGPHHGVIVNNGVVEAVSATGEAFGIWTSGLYLNLRNTGLIYASGGTTDDPIGIVGIRSGQSTGIRIENSGTIHVVSTQGDATVGISIFRDSPGAHAYGTVINSGTIIADTAIKGYAGYVTALHVTNSGRIEGDLDFDTGQNIVTNTAAGIWIGDLRLGNGQDSVRNAGLVDGDVLLGDGDDLFDGRGGTTTGIVEGGKDYDVLIGGASGDRLSGGEGDDRLWGGGGADLLTGGADADVFVYGAVTDSVSGAMDAITDFQTGIDRIDLGQVAPTSVSFSVSGGNTLVTVQTAAGALVFQVSGAISQADLILVPKSNEVTGSIGHDSLFATIPGSALYGYSGYDVLDGTAGNDMLDGGTGIDLMRGGDGNDIYVVDDGFDRVIELEGQGIDEVITFVSWGLHAFTENLTLLGVDPMDASGNPSDNIITGHAGTSWIRGMGGNDVIIGAGGRDFMWGDGGADIYRYLAASDSVAGAVDEIHFESGRDLIDLRTVSPISISWQETMGGYWAAFAISNMVTVTTSGGTMTIKVLGKLFLSDFLLGGEIVGTADANVLNGAAGADVIVAHEGNDRLNGLDGADTLSGQEGDDIIDGGTGADRMTGGAGDDVYHVDQAGDVVWEFYTEGRDTIIASASFVLGPQSFVEILQTIDRYGTAAINLTGNTTDNILYGNEGDNILDGGTNVEDPLTYIRAGTDTFFGYGGNDTYYVDGAEDIVREEVGAGFDTVFARENYILTSGAEIELLAFAAQPSSYGLVLDLTGNDYGQRIVGNASSNVLDGRGGADVLVGVGGNDRLIGGAGADWLEGGEGADTFVFAALADSRPYAIRSDGAKFTPDTIVDFVSGTDRIDLGGIDAVAGTGSNDAFSFLGTGAFSQQAGQVRYEVAGGRLNIFADINGDGVADLQIVLQTPVALTAADFIL